MKYDVTVIVPIYNALTHLTECLESIASQDYCDYEVILIDDGSIDGSGEISEHFAESNDNFRVIHKENAGVSAARNIGIDSAKGTFIIFVDSDDVLLPNFIGNAVKKMRATSADFLVAPFQILADEQIGECIDYLHKQNERISVETYLDVMAQYHTEAFWGANWAKMYRTELIHTKNIRFESGVQLAEDFRFNLEYLKYVHNIAVEHNPSCLYRIDTAGSLSKKRREPNRYWREYYELYLRYVALFEKHIVHEKYKDKTERFLMLAIYSVLRDCVGNEVSNIFPTYELLKTMLRETTVQTALFSGKSEDKQVKSIKAGIKSGKLYLVWLFLLNERIQIKKRLIRGEKNGK